MQVPFSINSAKDCFLQKASPDVLLSTQSSNRGWFLHLELSAFPSPTSAPCRCPFLLGSFPRHSSCRVSSPQIQWSSLQTSKHRQKNLEAHYLCVHLNWLLWTCNIIPRFAIFCISLICAKLTVKKICYLNSWCLSLLKHLKRKFARKCVLI